MPYSTGRGGAGNIQTDSNKTSHENEAMPVNPSEHNANHDDSKRIYYSTGRGGAGNIHTSGTIPSPKLVPQGSNTPQLTGNLVSTGRGGYGNMLKNDNPELTRKAQDVDPPSSQQNDLYAVASSKSFAVGRGGYGNVVSQTKSNESGQNNLMAVSSHGEKKHKQEHKKSFFEKVKGFFN